MSLCEDVRGDGAVADVFTRPSIPQSMAGVQISVGAQRRASASRLTKKCAACAGGRPRRQPSCLGAVWHCRGR